MNDVLQTIDWYNDDGVNFPMINGYARNSFYDRMLKEEVKDKVCLDIGFGTGLLSVIALKHGAKKVIAYESNYTRFILGTEIISRAGLQDKITLINKRYVFDIIHEHPEVEIIFCETVDQNLWGEGLTQSIGSYQSAKLLPSTYIFEVRAFEVPDNFVKRILNPNIEAKFNPSIDIDQQFVDAVNSLICERYGSVNPYTNTYSTGLNNFNQFNRRFWELQVINKSSNQLPVVGYEIDINEKTLFIRNQTTTEKKEYSKNMLEQDFTVDTTQWEDKLVILIPRVGMKYNGKVLYLEDAEGWGPANDPVILAKPTGKLKINHNFTNGKITIKNI